MIGLIDSGICNLASVIKAFKAIGTPVCQINRPEQLASVVAVVLPGVGAFGDGMESLRSRGLIDPLKRAVLNGTPLLGICLGMQMLLDESEEHGHHLGLGLISGSVVRLNADRPGFRVPNIGWCDVTPRHTGVMFPEGTKASTYYFVHSYHVDTLPDYIAATTDFSGHQIAAALEKENISGVQFHPEKSQDAGLDLLARWVGNLRKAGRVEMNGTSL